MMQIYWGSGYIGEPVVRSTLLLLSISAGPKGKIQVFTRSRDICIFDRKITFHITSYKEAVDFAYEDDRQNSSGMRLNR